MAVKEIFPLLPKASELIGRILMGYSELEVGVMQCLPGEFDYIFKEMFVKQGADKRLKKALAFGNRAFVDNKNLGKDFAIAIECVDHCRKIRNQYAHNQWYAEENDMISFLSLEEIVKELKEKEQVLKDFSSLIKHKANIKLLEDQLNYFDYTERFLLWLKWESSTQNNIYLHNPHQKPVKLERPELYI